MDYNYANLDENRDRHFEMLDHFGCLLTLYANHIIRRLETKDEKCGAKLEALKIIAKWGGTECKIELMEDVDTVPAKDTLRIDAIKILGRNGDLFWNRIEEYADDEDWEIKKRALKILNGVKLLCTDKTITYFFDLAHLTSYDSDNETASKQKKFMNKLLNKLDHIQVGL